ADFDATLERIRASSGRLMTNPAGAAGRRRVCLQDPDGVLIEVMEDMAPPSDQVRPDFPTTCRSVTLSVPDLERAARFWVDGMGLVAADGVALHEPEHEALWGLKGAQRRELLLRADDFFVELVEYTNPVGRSRPAGHMPCDHGAFNIA